MTISEHNHNELTGKVLGQARFQNLAGNLNAGSEHRGTE
jgi:hypothetical protein